MKLKAQLVRYATIIFCGLTLTSCGGNDLQSSKTLSQPYVAPPMKTVSYEKEAFMTQGNVGIFTANAADGYVCAMGTSDKNLKFQVESAGQKYNYDLNLNGEVEVFPLQLGSGTYQFSIYEHVSDQRYIQLLTTSCDVQLKSEFEAFLRPNQIVNYSENSKVVALSNEIVKDASNEAEAVELLYQYVIENIEYDVELAKNVSAGYVPDIDKVLETQKGICYDYAALCAAMLRSQGIPTKLVTGYVAPSDLYHAWNMIYLEGSGWKYKEIAISKNSWGLVDPTFDASRKGISLSDFIGDGTTYVEKYTY